MPQITSRPINSPLQLRRGGAWRRGGADCGLQFEDRGEKHPVARRATPPESGGELLRPERQYSRQRWTCVAAAEGLAETLLADMVAKQGVDQARKGDKLSDYGRDTQRDVKNEGRSDYVYENKGKRRIVTPCSP